MIRNEKIVAAANLYFTSRGIGTLGGELEHILTLKGSEVAIAITDKEVVERASLHYEDSLQSIIDKDESFGEVVQMAENWFESKGVHAYQIVGEDDVLRLFIRVTDDVEVSVSDDEISRKALAYVSELKAITNVSENGRTLLQFNYNIDFAKGMSRDIHDGSVLAYDKNHAKEIIEANDCRIPLKNIDDGVIFEVKPQELYSYHETY